MTPTQQLANALPRNPEDHGPVAVPSDAIRGVLAFERAAEAFQALALRIWSGDSPLGCGDVHTVADLDRWVLTLPEDEAAAFNAMLGEGFAGFHPWDGDHPVAVWTRRDEDRA